MRQETYKRMLEEAWEDAKEIGSVYVGYDDRYLLYSTFDELMKEEFDGEEESDICDEYGIERDDTAMYLACGSGYPKIIDMVYSVDDLNKTMGW